MLKSSEVIAVRHLAEKVSQLSSEARVQLLNFITETFCSECGSGNLVPDFETGEIICGNCGLVQKGIAKDPNSEVEFSISKNTSPTSYLAFGKSLGDTLPYWGICKVLAKMVTPNGEDLTEDLSEELKAFLQKNIGLRARFIRIYNSSVDIPGIKKAIAIGESLCKEFGMIGEDAVKFREYLGKMLRRVCAVAIMQKRDGETFEARRLTITTFVLVWQLMELQNGLRKKVCYQATFPSISSKRRGLSCVPLHRYKIRKKDWDFVLRTVQLVAPTTVLRKPHNGEM